MRLAPVSTRPGFPSFARLDLAANPAWGVRKREDVEQEAQRVGQRLRERHAIPASNLI